MTLKTDVEFDFDPADCEFAGLDTDALRGHLEELGFKALLARLPATAKGAGDAPRPKGIPPRDSKAAPPAKYAPLAGDLFSASDGSIQLDAETSDDEQYTLVKTEADLKSLISDLRSQKKFAFDTETDSLDVIGAGLVGLSFSWAAEKGYYVPVRGGRRARRRSTCRRRLTHSGPSWRTTRSRRSATTSSTTSS